MNMACEATYVGKPPLLWSARGDSTYTDCNAKPRSKMPTLQKDSPAPIEDKPHWQKSRSLKTQGILPDRSHGPNLGGSSTSPEATQSGEQYLDQYDYENSNRLPSDSFVEDSSTIKRIGAMSLEQLKKTVTRDARDADLYLSQSSETTLQNDCLENQYKIPTICLEPPASPGFNSALGATTEELSNLRNQNGLRYFDSWYSEDLAEQHNLMTSTDSRRPATSSDPSIELPSRYQKRLQQDLENGNVLVEGSVAVTEDDMNQREEDLGTALKWIRQEILEMKEQDKSLLKQFIELRASILQLRCLYDLDLHGSYSDISSVGSGSTYSLNEPGGGGGMNYASSSSSISNINKIHINSSSNCNVLKSPHQLRRMLLMGGGDLGRGGARGAGGQGSVPGMVSLSLPNSPRIARLRWRSDEII